MLWTRARGRPGALRPAVLESMPVVLQDSVVANCSMDCSIRRISGSMARDEEEEGEEGEEESYVPGNQRLIVSVCFFPS
eukprot:4008482-Pyramimonas_sp.AAC.1